MPYNVKRVVDLRSEARAYTMLGLKTLASIMVHSKQDAVRVQAAALMFERGWGKAFADDPEGARELRVVIRHIVEGAAGIDAAASAKVIDHDASPGPETRPNPFD